MKTVARIVVQVVIAFAVGAVGVSAVEPAAVASFLTSGPTGVARSSHSSTLIANGKVLVAGGLCRSGVTNSAELYDPATGKWTATSSMNTARYVHSATLLPSGKVLIAGGFGTRDDLTTTAELYDPATATWRSEEHTSELQSRGLIS